MDSKSQLTVDVIAKVAEGKIDIVNAGKVLNKSRRTVERYLQRYREIGIKFVVHGNAGKTPANKTCESMKRKVQKLIKKKYFDLNLTHMGEMLVENEGIHVNRETLRGWAHEIHHVKRAKRRRSQIRKRRERMESPGLLLQMDGSTHRWFGDKKSCLIALIDDATSEVHAEFFDAEGQNVVTSHKSNVPAKNLELKSSLPTPRKAKAESSVRSILSKIGLSQSFD